MNKLSDFDFHHCLVLGGAASGKSLVAERLAKKHAGEVCYIATSQLPVADREWQLKVARHRKRRPAHWRTIEEPLALVPLLQRQGADADRLLLVDCLTLWLGNLLEAGADLAEQRHMLCATLAETAAKVILVSNEIGMGLVPELALARAFRDAQGELNQQLAASLDGVLFVAAGLPLRLKQGDAGSLPEF